MNRPQPISRALRGPALAGAVLLAFSVAHADELCLTGNARGNANMPVEFTVAPESAAALFDGSHHDTQSIGWKSGAITVTFAQPVRITRAHLVVYNDRQRSYNAALEVALTATLAGAPAASLEPVSLDADPVLLCGTDDRIIWGSESESGFPNPVRADALQVRIDKQPQASQCLLRELQIWGIPDSLADAPSRPIPFSASENTCSSIRADWSAWGEPATDEYIRVRHRVAGAALWQTSCFRGASGLIRFLRPDTEYELIAEIVGATRTARAEIESQRLRLPHPLAVRRMGDLWGMNFYPGGGGAHQRHEDETAVTRAMLDLLRTTEVRHLRWFALSPAGADLFTEAGMSFFPFAGYEDSADYQWVTDRLGVWLAATQNEPDFGNTRAEEFVRKHIPHASASSAFDPLMLLAGPAIGGELFGPGSDYLADCYRAGLTSAIHALDLHPYTKTSTPTAPGGVLGGPEGVLESLAACSEIMRQFGDEDRPIIVSEAGHPTQQVPWFMPPRTHAEQAQMIVRSHLLLAASGVRRIYWYAFQDEGTDPGNAEHNFGIVDWHGKPKPAYFSYKFMASHLKDAQCQGLEGTLTPPAYGVRCAHPDGATFTTALWDCGGSGELVLAPTCRVSRVLDLFGEDLPLPARTGAGLTIPIDEGVCYVVSSAPLRFLSQRRIAPPVAPRVLMSLAPSTVRVEPGGVATWQVTLTSEFDCDVTATITTRSPWGPELASAKITLPPRAERSVTLRLDVPADAPRKIISWDARCQTHPVDPQWPATDFRRALFFIVGQ